MQRKRHPLPYIILCAAILALSVLDLGFNIRPPGLLAGLMALFCFIHLLRALKARKTGGGPSLPVWLFVLWVLAFLLSLLAAAAQLAFILLI